MTTTTLADYGVDVTTADGAARFLVSVQPPRPLDTANAYVGAVRRRLDRAHARGESLDWIPVELRDDRPGKYVDGRLIAAVWRNPAIRPSEWRADGRAAEWLGYWLAQARRPAKVGSEYNPMPEHAARSWALGLRRVVAARSSRWRGQRERLRLLLRVRSTDHVAPCLRTADLRRWMRLSPAFRHALAHAPLCGVFAENRRHVNWAWVAEQQRRFAALPRAALQAARVSAQSWLRFDSAPETVEALGLLTIAVQVAVFPRPWRHIAQDGFDAGLIEAMLRLSKAGRFAAVAIVAGPSLLQRVAERIAEGHVLPTDAVAHAATLTEWVDATAPVKWEVATEAVRRSWSFQRAWDRLAQRRPDVAIEGWHHEYTRGRRLAPLLGEVLAFLRGCVANGETVVVLGRDGELVHQLCRRAGVRTRYALASRALTTKASTPVSAQTKRVLDRICGDRPVTVVDTGFAGSIPVWMRENGFRVERVALLCANDAEQAMPIRSLEPHALRTTVLSDLEHAAQRLESPSSWAMLAYAHDAPGFWARLYGVCDALGLKRQVR